MSRLPKPTSRSQQLLEEIARTLDVPVSSFHGKESGADANDLATLAGLYSAITDAEGRQRVMTVARREAERCRRAVGN